MDAYNSPHLIPHLQCEADVLSGARLHRNKRSPPCEPVFLLSLPVPVHSGTPVAGASKRCLLATGTSHLCDPYPIALGCVLYAGRLRSLQGGCVPALHAWGHWKGRAMFVVATSIISGRHPEAGQESASAKASAEQVRTAEAGHLTSPHLISSHPSSPPPARIACLKEPAIVHMSGDRFDCKLRTQAVLCLCAGAASHPCSGCGARRRLRGEHPGGR